MKPRRLLLISYHFPPSNEVAGKPTARLVRHLRDFGWDVTVLTIPADDERVTADPHSYADVVADARIVRVPRGIHPREFVGMPFRAVKRLFQRHPAAQNEPSAPQSSSTSNSVVGGMKRSLREYLEFPDIQAGWVGPAYRKARELLKTERFDAMMTVSPAPSTHLIGLRIRRWSKIPWVAQLHDPWVGNPFHPWSAPGLARLTRYWERQTAETCNLMLGATDEVTQQWVDRYPKQPTRKFQTLNNGFDAADFPSLAEETIDDDGPLRLTHTGTLYGGRNPFPLFEAVAELARRQEIRTGEFVVDLIGDCRQAMGRPIADVAAELGIRDFVNIQNPVPYPEALAALARSQVLVLFAQNQLLQVPAKLYEYLYVNRFILGFTSGASARIIREAGAGEVVETDSVEETIACLRRILALHRVGGLVQRRVSEEVLRPYTARYLAEFLSERLDGLVGCGPLKAVAMSTDIEQSVMAEAR